MSDNIPELETYFMLQEQRDSLIQMADSATTANALYTKAIATADEKIAALEASEIIQKQLGALVLPLQTAISENEVQLAALQPAVELGLLSLDDITEQHTSFKISVAERIQSDPRLAIAWRVFNKVAVSETVEYTPSDDTPEEITALADKPEEAETPKQAIKITRRGNGIMIGAGGKLIRLSGARSNAHRDYSEERAAVLKTLVQAQGKQLSANELWDTTFPGTPFDRITLAQVKRWLDSITYRRKPVVVHNGKRGNASRYGITDFDITYTEESVVRASSLNPAAVEADITVGSTKENELLPVAASTPLLSGPHVPSKHREKKVQAEQLRCKFPLDLLESSMIASFLYVNRNVFESLSIPPIDEAISNNLNNHTTQEQYVIAMQQYGDIQTLRSVALAKIEKFFEDDDLVLDTLELMSDRDHRYPLFTYLMDIDGEDRWGLFDKLAQASRVTDYAVDAGRRASYAIHPDSVHTKLVLPDRTELSGYTSKEASSSAHTAAVHYKHDIDTPIDELQPTLSDTLEAASPQDTNVEAEQATVDLQSWTEDIPDQSNELDVTSDSALDIRADFERELRSTLQNALELVRQFSLDGAFAAPVMAVFNGIKKTTIKNASENGHISRNDNRILHVRDILILHTIELHKQAFSVQRSKTKPDRKLILATIDSVLAEYRSDR